MAGSRRLIKVEDRHVKNDSSLSSSKSGSPAFPSSSGIMDMQRTCTVSIMNIPSSFVAFNLTQEPGLQEGLVSMFLDQKSGTLVYSAPWYAEALIGRSAKSLNKRYGIELALLIDPINSARQEDSEDDCIITAVGQVQKELVNAPTRKQVPGNKSVIKRPVLANSPLDLSGSVGNRATVQLSPSSVPVTQRGSLQTPPPSRQHSLRSLRTGGPTLALEAAPTNLSTETKSYPALESHLDATGNHGKQHDGVKLTSVPSAGISDEYVHHDMQYNLLICKRCHLAEAPKCIVDHCKMFHYEEPGVRPDTIDMLYQKYHFCGAARNLQEANIPFSCPFIPYLAVYHTYLKCGACLKVFRGQDLDAPKKHLLSHFTSDGWYSETDYEWIIKSEFSFTQIFSNVSTLSLI